MRYLLVGIIFESYQLIRLIKNTMTKDLQDQYEAYPYPHRDPSQEPTRNTETIMNDLSLVAHFLTCGVHVYHDTYQALVAGGGTGDATVHLAKQLARIQPKARVVHLDLSATSIAISKQRIQALNLENVHFEQASLLDVKPDDFGLFDYINCSGVLHHLESPEAGARALASVLKPNGGLSIMLYGALGRRGIYDVQDMMRMVKDEQDDLKVLIPLTRQLLQGLPPVNPYRRSQRYNPQANENELVDMYLHVRDRAYTVPEVLQLLHDSGLKLVSFIPPVWYDPLNANLGPKWKERLESLSSEERLYFGELLFGTISRHLFFAAKAENREHTLPDPKDQSYVPIIRGQGVPIQKKYLNGSLPGIKFQ